MCPQVTTRWFRDTLTFAEIKQSVIKFAPAFPTGGVESVGPESPPLQPNYQAFGGEVRPLPSSG